MHVYYVTSIVKRVVHACAPIAERQRSGRSRGVLCINSNVNDTSLSLSRADTTSQGYCMSATLTPTTLSSQQQRQRSGRSRDVLCIDSNMNDKSLSLSRESRHDISRVLHVRKPHPLNIIPATAESSPATVYTQ